MPLRNEETFTAFGCDSLSRLDGRHAEKLAMALACSCGWVSNLPERSMAGARALKIRPERDGLFPD
jgi:hypothetical protein